MAELVDTHCHIQSIGQTAGERIPRELWAKTPELTADNVVTAASGAGVTRLICVGCSLEDSRLAADFVKKRKECFAAVGIHPHEARHHLSGEKLSKFAALVTEPKVVAIGECGLDFYYDHSPRADQLKVLEFQLALAADSGLPVI